MDAGADLKEHGSGPGKQMDQMSGVQSAQRTNDKVPGSHRSSASRTNNSTWVRVAALSLLIIPLIVVSSCQRQVARAIKPLKPPEQQTEIRALPANSSPDLKLVIASAIDQVGKTTSYDPSYQRIEYPNGDVPI